jgi:two-component system NtrC family response regulator
MSAMKVLVVDDDESIRTVLEFNVKELGFEVLAAENAEKGWEVFKRDRPDLVLTDVRMEGMSGLDLLAAVRQADPGALVIVMTAYGSVKQAVEAMKQGAYDYVTKPFDRESLRLTVRKAAEFAVMRRENARLRSEISGRFTLSSIVGDSPAMKAVFALLARVAPTDATVLIEGETGTGKELVARSLHYMSSRKPEKFVVVNCAAIPRELLESELFGHEKGAFTGATAAKTGKFQLADGGSIFLDEIGEIDMDLQKRLLRVLQEREVDRIGASKPVRVDVRVIAATNHSLAELVKERRFREDLYYRLSVVPVTLPPLRERREDIPLLIASFLEKHGGAEVEITPAAVKALQTRAWPGNVRELENTVERLLILRRHPARIDEADLSDSLLAAPEPSDQLEGLEIPDEGLILEEVEKRLIESALRKAGGNQSAAARLLGISRQTLLYRMQKFSIPRKAEGTANGD